jgi:xanthine dehydrogenase molybdopterin-binding subunit B
VKVRRTGGGFGGKLTRQIPVSAAAALAAYVTGKQVHVQLDRCQDSVMVRLETGSCVAVCPPFDDSVATVIIRRLVAARSCTVSTPLVSTTRT